MTVVQPLLDLQEIDGRIREFQQELKDIPARKKDEQERLNGALTVLAEAQTALKTAQSKVDDLEAEVKTRQEKIQKLKHDQSELKSNNDFRMFNVQIVALEGEIERLEAQQVAAMDDLIPPKHRVAEAEAKLAQEQQGVDGFVAEMDARSKEVSEALNAALAERAAFVKNVPPNFYAYYERLRTKRWPVVVALLPDCVCNGCHLVQPPSVGQMVLRNQGIVACQMCGRILYGETV